MTSPARFLDAPQDPDLQALYHLWRGKRGLRLMPSRSDFDPAEFPRLLGNIVMIDVAPFGGPYTVRLMGEEVVDFSGRSGAGRIAGSLMTPEGSKAYTGLLDMVLRNRSPIFRAGEAYWSPDQPHRRFEACFLPLSADDRVVNMILGAVKFE